MTGDDIWAPDRGGHDPVKIHAALRQALADEDRLDLAVAASAVARYGLDAAKPDPMTV
jgi:pyruvate dehydrogenase complex dehydrogenase (E1) component